ncbi:MAG TPA: TolC family protein [Chitinophagaceae bacterium]|nr:TolC family protein [Chitinophagaceae bacterium]
MGKKRFIIYLIFLLPVYSFEQTKDLNYYISNAVTNSPLLNDLRNQLLSNSIDSQILKASNGVQINGNGNSYVAPIRNGYGYDEAITNGQQLQALITATKNLLPKKYLNLQFRDLQITGDSIRIASKISEQDLKKTIIGQYITTYGDQLQIDFNNQLHDLLTREEVILKRLTQRNVYKQVDYLSFLVTYQQQNLTQQLLEVQYKNDYATLNYLAGIFDTSFSKLAPPDINVALNFVTDTSAFFLKYALDSLRLINNKALIDLGYRPHINVYADGGFNSSLNYLPYKNFGNSVGISFVIPIYDGGQKKLQYSKIAIAERTRLRNKEFFQNQYYQQIAQLRQQLYAIEGLLGTINKQIKYIETLIEVNGKLLETGDIKMTDYVLALNNYVTAKNLVVQNMISRYQVINQINYWNK